MSHKSTGLAQGAGVKGEVIVVDNGSDDASASIAAAAGARVVCEEHKGYGSALRRGIGASQGRYVVMGDCDDTYDFTALDGFLQALRDGAEMVVGNRYAGIQPGAMTWSHRYISTPVITWLVRLFSKSDLGDSQCGLRGFSRVAYERMELSSDGMEFASEMIICASRLGMAVREIPIRYYPRIGETKLETIRDGWRHLRYLLLATPNGLYAIPGTLLGGLGALILGLSITSQDGVITVAGISWQPLFAGPILLVVGFNALLFGGVAHLYTAATGITPVSGFVHRLASRFLRFERTLIAAGVLLVAGLSLEFVLTVANLDNAGAPHRASLAGLAHSLILMAGNFGFAGFLASLIRGTSTSRA